MDKNLEVNDFFTDKTLNLISAVENQSNPKIVVEIESLIHEYIITSGIDLPTAVIALSDLLSTYLMTADASLIRKMQIPRSNAIH